MKKNTTRIALFLTVAIITAVGGLNAVQSTVFAAANSTLGTTNQTGNQTGNASSTGGQSWMPEQTESGKTS